MIKSLLKLRSAVPGLPVDLVRLLLAGLFVFLAAPARATLESYDSAINEDAGSGLVPLAKMTSAVALTGRNRAAFNFGNSSGDVTMEFILVGDPSVGGTVAYLAVGSTSGSSLRFEQSSNTGQLGFSQSGAPNYLFTPVVPSPTQITHVAFVWNAALLTMKLYLNGSVAGERSGVSPAFAMPKGQGWLGANSGNTENMTGRSESVV